MMRFAEEPEDEKEEKGGKKSGAPKKKFEVKKWNAVALWAWGILPCSRMMERSRSARHRCR